MLINHKNSKNKKNTDTGLEQTANKNNYQTYNKINMSLKYRKDNRSTKKFKKDIENRTSKEKFLVEYFIDRMEVMGYDITVINNGIDNTGKMLKKVSSRADYRIIINGVEGLYDIKCGPVKSKCIFKTHNLKQYVKNNASILLFYNTGFIDKPPHPIKDEAKCAIIRPKKIQKMLNDHKSYREFTFGNKECIKILEKNFNKYYDEIF
jgi:hypothetical protein